MSRRAVVAPVVLAVLWGSHVFAKPCHVAAAAAPGVPGGPP